MVSLSLRVFRELRRSSLVKNSSWGVMTQVVQSVLMSLFFVIIARHYSIKDFATYIVASALYQLMTVLSTLGLSYWFMRELTSSEQRKDATNTFFKLQFYLGLSFFFLNVFVARILYDDPLILKLSILFGANIAIDNIINGIKCLNVVEFNQKRTFQIVSVETLLKFLVSCLLFFTEFSILTLCLLLFLIRLVSLNLFLKWGTSELIDVKSIWRHRLSLSGISRLVIQNWPFIIIGSVSILNWRVANIIISKILTETDVANYEVSYKLFSVAQIIPVVASTTIFPKLVSYYNNGSGVEFRRLYNKMFAVYFGFGLISFACVAGLAQTVIPFFFGAIYSETYKYAVQMFLAMLVFPTVFLQANVILAMKLEKLDMYLNIAALVINVSVCLVGLQFFKSLTVVNIAIFLSFLVFHIMQDVILVSKGVTTLRQVVLFYLALIALAAYVFAGPFTSI